MADTSVTNTWTVTTRSQGLFGPYWYGSDTAYAITSQGGGEIQCHKTTSPGSTWTEQDDTGRPGYSGTYVDEQSFGCHWDRDTPGDDGTKMHIGWLLASTDDLLVYTHFDTSTDEWKASVVTVNSSWSVSPHGTPHNNTVAITKSRSGLLYILCSQDNNNSSSGVFYVSDDDGATWTSKANPFDSDLALCPKLFPGNETDEDDIWGVAYDQANDDIEFWHYDASANTWSKTAINTSITDSTGAPLESKENGGRGFFDAAIRHSDGHLLVVMFNAADSSTGDFESYDINGSGSITAKGNLHTNVDDSFFPGIFIDPSNDDVYVSYSGSDDGTEVLNSAVNVYYKKSTDGMATWGTEQSYSENTADDVTLTSGGSTGGGQTAGRFMPLFFNDDFNTAYVNDTNDVAISQASVTETVNPTGTLTSAGALTRDPAKDIAGTLTSAGAMQTDVFIVLAAAMALAGVLAKSATQSVAGTLTSSGALTALKTSILAAVGTLTTAGAMGAWQVNKAITGTLTSAGSLLKHVTQDLAGTLSLAGTLAALKTSVLAVTGTLTSAGALQAQANIVLAGTASFAGALTNAISQLLSVAGTLTTSGTLVRAPSKVVSGILSSAGALSNGLSYALALAGTLTTSGALRQVFPGIIKLKMRAGSVVKSTMSAGSTTFTRMKAGIATHIRMRGG